MDGPIGSAEKCSACVLSCLSAYVLQALCGAGPEKARHSAGAPCVCEEMFVGAFFLFCLNQQVLELLLPFLCFMIYYPTLNAGVQVLYFVYKVKYFISQLDFKRL